MENNDLKNQGGRPRIELTDEQKKLIQVYARLGVPAHYMAMFLNISERTLWNRIAKDPEVNALYKKGELEANIQVAKWLFEACKPKTRKTVLLDKNGNVAINPNTGEPFYDEEVLDRGDATRQIFWLKTRANWKETVVIEDTNRLQLEEKQNELQNLSDDDIESLIGIFGKLHGAGLTD